MKNAVHKKIQNTYDLIWRPFFLVLIMLSASLVIDSSNAEIPSSVQVTKIHQKFAEEDMASVAFTVCSGDNHLTLPEIVVSSDLQTKSLSLMHDLRPNVCIGETIMINVYDVSTITASVVPEIKNILQYEQTAETSLELVYLGMSNDGSLSAEITSERPVSDKRMEINLKFTDILGNPVKNVNYDVVALQDNYTVLSIKDLHSAYGSNIITTNKLISDSAVEVNLMIHGIGFPGQEGGLTGPKGEVIVFHVIPEFGTITIMILTASILSILMISFRFRSLVFIKTN